MATPVYVHQPYPSWRSHATLPSLIVKSPEDDAEKAALGYYHPSAPPSAESPADESDPAAKTLYQTPVKDMEAFVATLDSLEDIEAMKALEIENPNYKGGRKTVLLALDARMDALTTPQTLE